MNCRDDAAPPYIPAAQQVFCLHLTTPGPLSRDFAQRWLL
jgi:hypothetical protein